MQDTFAAVHASAAATAEATVLASGTGSTAVGTAVANWKAYLCRTVTNRCMDVLKSTRKKRELYVGPWLPEPLVQHVGSVGEDPLHATILEETVSYAFMVMLERLTALERAVFVLREAFGYSYRDIADTVGKTELGCRQIYSRVRRKVQAEPTQVHAHVDVDASRTMVRKFLYAATTGNVNALIELLSQDAILVSDGGGKRNSAVHPIVGRDRILVFLAGIAAKFGVFECCEVLIGGETGLILSSSDGPTVVLFARDALGRCSHIYFVRNPDKLTSLERVLALQKKR